MALSDDLAHDSGPSIELLCRVSNPIFYRAKGALT